MKNKVTTILSLIIFSTMLVLFSGCGGDSNNNGNSGSIIDDLYQKEIVSFRLSKNLYNQFKTSGGPNDITQPYTLIISNTFNSDYRPDGSGVYRVSVIADKKTHAIVGGAISIKIDDTLGNNLSMTARNPATSGDQGYLKYGYPPGVGSLNFYFSKTDD